MKPKNKIPKTFISFLITSILIWLLITLSKEYIINVSFPVKYEGISQNKILQVAPKENLEIIVKASGFKILKTRLSSKKITINAGMAVRKKGTKYFLLTKNQQGSIQKQMPNGIALQEILKDTLYLDLGSLVTKKVPVKPNLSLKFGVGYDLSETIKITPDSILVFGPETYISKLNKIDLLPLKLENIKTDFNEKVGIKIPANVKNLKFSDRNVIIQGKIENFTEGTLEVPYKIINVPEGITINTLSKKVSISFIIGLNNFNKINKNSFQVVCDFASAQKNGLNYFVPKLLNKPDLIKSYKIVPNKIDFLIEK